MNRRQWLFASACAPGLLYLYRLEKDALLPARAYAVPGGPRAIAFGPGMRMYLSTQDAQVHAFDCARPAQLRLLRSVHCDQRLCSVAVSPDGRLLIGTSYNGGQVEAWRLDASGLPQPAGAMRIETAPAAHCVCFTPDGSAFYVPHPDVRRMARFQVVDGGIRLERLTQMPVDIRHMKRTGPLYLGIAYEDNLLCLLKEQHGGLALLDSASTLPPGFRGYSIGSELHIARRRGMVYAANRGADTIAAFAVRGGTLKAAGHIPVDPEPISFCLGADEQSILVAGRRAGRVQCIRLAADGVTPVSLTQCQTGDDILWMACREENE